MIFGRKPTARPGGAAKERSSAQAAPASSGSAVRTRSGGSQQASAPLEPSARRLTHLWTDTLGTAGTRSLQIILVIILAAGAIIAMRTLSIVVIPLILGIILACALWPLIRYLRKWLSPMLSAWIVLLGAFLVLGGILAGIVTSVVGQWDTLSKNAQQGFSQVQEWFKDLPIQIDQKQLDEWLAKAGEFLTSSQFGSGALTGLSAAGSFFVGAGALLVMLFFFLKDGDTIWRFFMSWFPERVRPTWNRAGTRARDVFGGYLRGTTIVAAVDAIGIGLVMAAIGVPLAFPLAVLVFLGGYIPMVGATVAGVLSVLVTLVSSGLWQAIAVAIATVVIQQLEGNLLQPVVMGNTLHLHGLVILITLTGGSVLGGIVGALISVPLVAAAWAVIKVFTGRETPDDDPAERKRRRKVRKQAKRRAKALAS